MVSHNKTTTAEKNEISYSLDELANKKRIRQIDNYVNMPMLYTEIVFGCKNENFHWKKIDIFLIFAQNIDCGYTLELPPRRF